MITVNIAICENCGQVTNYPAVKGIRPDISLILCDQCYSTHEICIECNTLIPKEDITIHNDNNICNVCFEKNYNVCSCCDGVFHNDELYGHNDELYCERCESENFTCCYHCDEWVEFSEATEINDNCVCDDCRDEYYTECNRCGDYISNDQRIYIDEIDEYYCENCYEYCGYCDDCGVSYVSSECHRCGGSGDIMSYSYKPAPIFHHNIQPEQSRYPIKGERYFGIELEVEGGDGSHKDTVNEIKSPYLYFKHDGSINDGFEIVSHPMSWDFIKKNTFNNTLEILRNRRYQSHNAESSCGFHVHVNKDSLSRCDIFKILKFFKDNKPFIVAISQRNEDKLNEWARIDDTNETITYKAKNKSGRGYSRYTAVNITSQTVEFRVFRGNLRHDRIMKNLEFVKAICEFVSCYGLMDMTKENFMRYINSKNKIFTNLISFIKEKELN